MRTAPILAVVIAASLGCKRQQPEPQQKPEQAQPQQAAAAPPAPETPTRIAEVGFKTPESVLYDATADVYLVSNINGSPLEADDNGFISRVSPSGEVVSLKWIDGANEAVTLSAPKGMARVGDTLYVTDIDTLRKFDANTGAPKGEVKIPGATFLNDVAPAPQGGVYVSDSGLTAGEGGFAPSGTDAVYLVSADDKVQAIAKGAELNRPNGVWPAEQGVWVVTFGASELYRVAAGTPGKQDVTKLPSGSLDGLVQLVDGSFLISSWDASAVFHGKPGGSFAPVVRDAKAPADIGWDSKRQRVLVPLFQDNALLIQRVGEVAVTAKGP